MDRRDVWAVSKPVPCIISMVIISFMDRSVESELCIAILTATLGEENSHLFERTNVHPKRGCCLVRKYIINDILCDWLHYNIMGNVNSYEYTVLVLSTYYIMYYTMKGIVAL